MCVQKWRETVQARDSLFIDEQTKYAIHPYALKIRLTAERETACS